MSEANPNNQMVKWRLQELDKLISDFAEAIAHSVQAQGICEAEDFTNILLHIAGKAIVTSREVICLVLHGFADGAFALSRTIYEHFITEHFLFQRQKGNDFSDIIKDYYLDYHRKFQKTLLYSASALHYESLVEEIKKEDDELRKAASHKVARDCWWSGYGTFEELASAVDAMHSGSDAHSIYLRTHFLYKQACLSVHSNCFGNYWRLEAGTQYNGINTESSENGHGYPLELLSISMLTLVCEICEHMNIDNSAFQKGFNDLACYYVQINNQMRQ